MEDNLRSNILTIVPIMLLLFFARYEVIHSSWHRSMNASIIAHKRRKKKRIHWSTVNLVISDRQFRRIFWMNRDCFNCLCQRIICSVGEREFKSEAYIDAFLKEKDSIYIENIETIGGYLSGEVKFAALLRLLAG